MIGPNNFLYYIQSVGGGDCNPPPPIHPAFTFKPLLTVISYWQSFSKLHLLTLLCNVWRSRVIKKDEVDHEGFSDHGRIVILLLQIIKSRVSGNNYEMHSIKYKRVS